MQYEYIIDQQQANTALQAIHAQTLYVDTETTGLDEHNGKLRLVQLYEPGKPVIIIDMFRCREHTQLRALFERYAKNRDAVIVGQNIKFDLKFSLAYTFPIDFRVYDTMIAEQVIVSGQNGHGLSLDALERKYMRLEREKKSLQQGGWFAPKLSDKQLKYAAQDALSLETIAQAQQTILRDLGLEATLHIETDCIADFAEMEYFGLDIDRELLEKHTTSMQQWHDYFEYKIRDALGIQPDVNIHSHQQMVPILRKAGLDVNSIQKDILRPYAKDYEWVVWYLKCKKVRTLLTRTLPGLASAVNRKTGKIYPSFFQLMGERNGTRTGRPSTSDPNVLGMDKMLQSRGNIIAPEGYIMIDSDYSQVELRVIADIADDAALLDMFARNIDPYAETAKIAGFAEVDAALRTKIKVIALGLIYGMGSKTMCQNLQTKHGVSITVQETSELRDKILNSWPGVKAYHRTIKQQRNTETRTLSGRRRILSKFYFPEAVNSPVQGTAADIMKIALHRANRDLKALGGRVLLPVYDELLSIIPIDKKDAAMQCQETAMIEAGRYILQKVELKVVTTTGYNWFECSQED